MSVISASIVNELRKKTGAGMMDCKKALMESNGDMEKAIDYLRKKGQKISANRADRDAGEGAVIALTSSDASYGVVVELNCETDFVAKNEDFVALANQIAQVALANKPTSLDGLKELELNGVKISDRLVEEMAKIGEKIEVSSYALLEGTSVVSYIHYGNRIGVLVAMNQSLNADIEAAGKDVAMQIAAMNPISLSKDDVPADVIEREIEIGKDQARQEGKPEDMVEKIALGKLNKFYKESTLLNQEFVKDSSKSIAQMLDGVHKGLTVTAFKRIALG